MILFEVPGLLVEVGLIYGCSAAFFIVLTIGLTLYFEGCSTKTDDRRGGPNVWIPSLMLTATLAVIATVIMANQ